MKKEEASKIIAEFMLKGKAFANVDEVISYGEPNYLSLDALVPVWVKLKFEDIEIIKGIGTARGLFFSTLNVNLKKYDGGEQPTIQAAAAIATAKAIQEVSNEKLQRVGD